MEKITVLPKGTVIKIDGFPYELAEDAKVVGEIFKSQGDQKESNRPDEKKDYS